MEDILNLNNIRLPCSFIKSSVILTDDANTVHFRFSCTEILKWSYTHVHNCITNFNKLIHTAPPPPLGRGGGGSGLPTMLEGRLLEEGGGGGGGSTEGGLT